MKSPVSGLAFLLFVFISPESTLLASPPRYLLPPAYEISLTTLQHTLVNHPVRTFQDADLTGISPKAIAIFSDGVQALVKNADHQNPRHYGKTEMRELRGELYTFHFHRLIGSDLVPPVTLVRLKPYKWPWQGIRSSLNNKRWRSGDHLSLHLMIPWTMTQIKLPELLQNRQAKIDYAALSELNEGEQTLIRQFSDVIVMDYITGESDRLVQLLYNQDLSPNHYMMNHSVSNLMFNQAGRLQLVDNQRSFGFGYQLAAKYSQFENLQKEFIERICVFNTNTIQQLAGLDQNPDPVTVLEEYIQQQDPSSYAMITPLSTQYRKVFKQRLQRVFQQIRQCTESTAFSSQYK